MPITSLESFLFERKLVNVSSVEILQNSTLGIDVEHYLGRIYTYKKEQLLLGIGGVPVSLKAYIESDLAVFKEYNIRPLFVFPGLLIHKSQSSSTHELTDAEKHRELTWSRLYAKLSSSSVNTSTHLNESFRLHNDLISPRPMTNDLIKYFIEYGIDFLVAPNDPSHQLSYLYHSEVIDCIYGSTDLLLTQIDKFILGMEFLSKDFRFVDKQKVLTDLNLTERQLCDVSIVSGCSVQPSTFSTLPPMPKHNPVSPFQQMTQFKYALDLMYQYKSFNNDTNLYNYVSAFNDEALLQTYLKGNAAVKYMPVMDQNGDVGLYISDMAQLQSFASLNVFQEDLNDVSDNGNTIGERDKICVPNEVHEVVSQRLPSEIYFYLSIGLLPTRILEAITLNELHIRPPLEGGQSEGYKKLVLSNFADNAFDAQLNLVTQLLARYYQVKRVPVKYWFSEEPHFLNSRRSIPLSTDLTRFKIASSENKFSIASFFKDCTGFNEGSKPEIELIKMSDLISTSMLRALYLLDLSQPHLSIAKIILGILKGLLSKHPDLKNDTLEDIILTIVLVRLQFFDFFSLDKNYQSVPSVFKSGSQSTSQLSSNTKAQIALISRVFSFRRLKINPINYQGPISRSLLSFRSHHQFVRQILGDFVRTSLVDLITRLQGLKLLFESKDDWYSLVDQLPFFSDASNTLLGVVCEIYLEGCSSLSLLGVSNEECSQRSLQHLLNNVMQNTNPAFNINLASSNSITAEQMVSDLQVGSEFWSYFVSAMEIGNQLDSSFVDLKALSAIRESDKTVLAFCEALLTGTIP